ncbi:MAG: sulfatase-like hydrolase/transferase, partial [Pirellulaceae bacterium]
RALMVLTIFCNWLAGPVSASQPNFLVFLVDDYDKYETSPYGGKVLTPNLDRLAREGMLFHNAHVTSTVCTASRYTFLTGRYAGSSYCKQYRTLFPLGQQASPGFNVDLESDNMNIGGLLARNGYATGFVGKYHVGPGDDDFRRDKGLHVVAKNTPYSETINRQQRENESRYRELIKDRGFTWAKNIYWENIKAPFQMHNPEWTIEAAVEFLEANHDRPFYLHYSTTLLHGPNGSWRRSLDHPEITGAGKISRTLASMPPRDTVMKRIRAAGLTDNEAGYLWMDDSLGVLLEKLDQLKIADNTVVLFVADHGSYNKGSLLKNRGTEVPCLLRWPRGIKGGLSCRELIQNTDFVPTWLELAGVTPPPAYQIDGVSISRLFSKPAEPVRPYVYAEMGAARSIKTKTHNYIALRYTREQLEGVRAGNRRQLKALTGLSGGVSRSVNTTTNPYVANQLYDLRHDPTEQHNRAEDASQVEDLGRLQEFLKTELKRFARRPYGEFVPGGNAMAAGNHADVFQRLLKTARENRKQIKPRKAPK